MKHGKQTLALILALALSISSLGSLAGVAEEETFRIDFRSCSEIGVVGFDAIQADPARTSTATSDERYPVIRIPSGTYDLTPLNVYDNEKEMFAWECYEFLMYRVGNGEFEGRLAKEWAWEDDTHLIVKLYDYIHDWAGNAITASDVVFSYNLAVESGYTTGFNSFYYDGCEAVDDYTIRFNFTNKMESLIAFNEIFGRQVVIVDEEEYAKRNYAVDPVGTGPYTLKEFVPDSKIAMEMNENYWQTDELRSKYARATAQTIELVVMPESFQQANALLSGNTLVNYEIEKEEIPDFLMGGKEYGNYYMLVNPSGNIHGVVPNCSSESIMSNKDFRLAVWYGLDNDGIASGLGMTYTPASVISNPTIEDWNDEWYGWENCISTYDPTLSKQYLDASGYNGEELVIVCLDEYDKLGQIIMGYLSMMGVKSRLNILDRALIDEELSDPGKWDLYIHKSRNPKPTVNKLQEYLGIQFGKVSNKALNFVEDEKLQELLAVATHVDTYSSENTDAAMKYIIDEGYLYCPYYPISVKPYSKKIAAFSFRYGTNKVVWGACDYYLD